MNPITVQITMQRDSKGRWEMTFSGPNTGGALRVSKSIETATKQLTKVLRREFPDVEADPHEEILELMKNLPPVNPPEIFNDPPLPY